MRIGRLFSITLIALMTMTTSALAVTTVKSFAPSTNTTPGVWFENDVRTGGTASTVDLTGVTGDLENNQPLPIGAATITTIFDNGSKAEVGVLDDYGMPNDIFSSLSITYSYYKAANAGQNAFAAPSLKLTFYNATCDDPASSGDCYATLTYEPYWNGSNGPGVVTAPAIDQWETVSIDSTTGVFWTSAGFGNANGAGGPPLRTLADWLSESSSDFGDASLVLVSIGVGTYNQGQIGYFDDVQISHSSAGGGYTESYDFEPDTEGPVTSMVEPTTAPIDTPITLTALVDDSTTGNSTIDSAEYSIDGGGWMDMDAQDGTFNNVSEEVTADIGSYSEPQVLNVCVRGTDASGNTGVPECIMLAIYDPSAGFVTGGGWIDSPSGAMSNVGTDAYFNGFEIDTNNWFSVTRVASGTNGVTSATGDYHAEALNGSAFTRWGGYNDDPACAGGGICPGIFPAYGFDTSVDVYLDVNGGFNNDTRFDYTSAIYEPSGSHRRDFVFNCGFYNDTDATGSGNRFVCSASNNSSGWPKNPGRNPTTVATASGWYTFVHEFRDDGTGVLTVTLKVLDADGSVKGSWILSDPSDEIGITVGGNGYGWFPINTTAGIGGTPTDFAIDNSRRTNWEDPTGKATFGFVSKYKKGKSTPDGQTEFQFQAGDLNFHSLSYEWLVVTGSNYAMFKGEGTVNGDLDENGNPYKFKLWARDDDPDTFRIRIWWEDSESVEHVVYDNGSDQPISAGNIVIHTKKK